MNSSEARAPRPDWLASDYPSYDDLVNSWGYSVAAFETFGSYQGDHLALLEDGERVGLVVFGYGSCSGCDHLEAVRPWYDEDDADWQPVIDLADELRRGIHWESSRDALREWVDAHPENHWWSYDEEIAAWLNETLGANLPRP